MAKTDELLGIDAERLQRLFELAGGRELTQKVMAGQIGPSEVGIKIVRVLKANKLTENEAAWIVAGIYNLGREQGWQQRGKA